MNFYYFILFLFFTVGSTTAQNPVNNLQKALLAETPIQEDLQELCDEIGGRVTGSAANIKSVDWAMKKFEKADVQAIRHAFEMPLLWMEENCSGTIVSGDIKFDLQIVSKYQTSPGKYVGKLVVLESVDSTYLEQNSAKIEDNFVMIPSELCLDINGLFEEYIHATAIENAARKYGAKGIIFMSSRPKKLLYRYITSKGTDNTLPQFVLSREDAQRCIRLAEKKKSLEISVDINAKIGGSFQSESVIAEIKGTEHPDEIIIIGAHLDSWSLGTGANDNGCNVAMLIDIVRQMKQLNIQPKRTIRFALWNGEEQGYFGSWAYTKDPMNDLNKHILAMSIDIGSGGIIGFFTNGREALVPIVDEILSPISDLGPFNQINVPIIGTDNFDFMLEGVPNLVGAHKPASYGINYHASSDTYDKVDIASLKQNAAIVATVLMGFADGDDRLPRQTRKEIQNMIEETKVEFQMRMFNVWDSWINGMRGRKQ